MSDESQVFQAYIQSRLRNLFFLGAKKNVQLPILQVFTFTWVLLWFYLPASGGKKLSFMSSNIGKRRHQVDPGRLGKKDEIAVGCMQCLGHVIFISFTGNSSAV